MIIVGNFKQRLEFKNIVVFYFKIRIINSKIIQFNDFFSVTAVKKIEMKGISMQSLQIGSHEKNTRKKSASSRIYEIKMYELIISINMVLSTRNVPAWCTGAYTKRIRITPIIRN